MKQVTVFSEKKDVPQSWIFSFSTTVILKIRSRSPKSNQFFVMSQLHSHKNLVRIQHWFTRYCADKKVSCQRGLQQHTNADSNRIYTKINMSPSYRLGDIMTTHVRSSIKTCPGINFDFRYVRLDDLDVPTEKLLNCLQTVETLIRCRILWHLIWVCTVCQLPF